MARPAWRTRLLHPVLVMACLIGVLSQGAARTGVHAGSLNPESSTLAYPPPPVLASAAALLDATTGSVLYASHADRELPMASTTKIMTAVLALEHGHLSDLVPVSRAASSIGETTMGLLTGERVPMLDLLYGLLLPSGNDAGIAIAEHLGGSMAGFVRMMNARAAALQLTHTRYLNSYGFFHTPDGDLPGHHTSARDLVTLARYAMTFTLFRQVVSARRHTIPSTATHHTFVLTNINNFLYWYPGASGVKPGWTSGAGICQVVDVRRRGRHLIAAVLNTPNLYTDVRDLMNYALGDFTWHPSTNYGDTTDRALVDGPAAARRLYFPFTGHEIGGRFLSYFRAHGGLSVLGFPRTEVLTVEGATEQYFTNQVLDLDPAGGTVTALRLGLQALPSPTLARRTSPVPNTYWRTYYPQTGHSVTYRFRTFYLDQGGPSTFGYPLTDKVDIGGTLVQFFENTEFVWRPVPTGGGFVTLAPLGQTQLVRLGLLTPSGVPPLSAGEGPLPVAQASATATASATETIAAPPVVSPTIEPTGSSATATSTASPPSSASASPSASATPGFVAATPTSGFPTAQGTAPPGSVGTDTPTGGF